MAKRVLYLGDSLSMGAFGKTLDSRMRDDGHEVFTYVTGGATPYYWLSLYDPMTSTIGHWEKTPGHERRLNFMKRVPKVEELIARHRPEIVVVQTGTNLYATLRSKRRSKAENVRELTRLVENMCKTVVNSGAELYWIAPPDSHTGRYPRGLQDEMFAITRGIVESYGTVFASAEHTRFTDPYPKTDGIHYGPTEARAWGEKVASNFLAYAEDVRWGVEPPKPVIVAAAEEEPAPSVIEPLPPRAIPVSAPSATTLVATTTPIALVAAATFPGGGGGDVPAAGGLADGEVGPAPPAEPEPDESEEEVFVVKRAEPVVAPSDRVEVTMVLRAKSELPHMSEVTYKSAFAIYEWEVDRVESGQYPYHVIRIAHPVVWNGRRMGAADYALGRRTSLRLTVLSAYPTLEQLQTIDDLPLALNLPVYTASLD